MSDTTIRDLKARMMLGDLDKPFDLPECCCAACEAWRRRQGRPTYADMRAAIRAAGGEP